MPPVAKLGSVILSRNIQAFFAWPAVLGLAVIATLPGVMDVQGAFSYKEKEGTRVFISDKQFCAARCEERKQAGDCVASCQAALDAIVSAPSEVGEDEDAMQEDGKEKDDDEDGEHAVTEPSEACVKECEPLRLKCVAEGRQKCGPSQKCLGGEAELKLKCEAAIRPCLVACHEEEDNEEEKDGTHLEL